ncbi:MAG TPA: ATP-binding protein [Kofleriaceae bacterium]
MNKKLLSLFGLKWNPFAPDVPADALLVAPRIESFCWRVENLAREGGFALITGAPGIGKSSALRLLVERLGALREIKIGVMARPHSGVSDFYRELGDLFGVQLTPHNRWGGAKLLRERWQAHIDAALVRPVLVVDEAQDMSSAVLNEMRHLSSARLDSHMLLTTVLAGDTRLVEKFRSDDLLPLASRMRVKLNLDRATPDELEQCLRHAMTKAGATKLMTTELVATLCEHAAGNYRALMTMANELLVTGAQREVKHLDEKLFFDSYTPTSSEPAAKSVVVSSKRR